MHPSLFSYTSGSPSSSCFYSVKLCNSLSLAQRAPLSFAIYFSLDYLLMFLFFLFCSSFIPTYSFHFFPTPRFWSLRLINFLFYLHRLHVSRNNIMPHSRHTFSLPTFLRSYLFLSVISPFSRKIFSARSIPLSICFVDFSSCVITLPKYLNRLTWTISLSLCLWVKYYYYYCCNATEFFTSAATFIFTLYSM